LLKRLGVVSIFAININIFPVSKKCVALLHLLFIILELIKKCKRDAYALPSIDKSACLVVSSRFGHPTIMALAK
jgi:hypothetical protein